MTKKLTDKSTLQTLKKISLIPIFLFWHYLTISPQRLQHFDLTNGLSSSEITAICENEQYIWIATEDGLNRFDGHHFKIYKSKQHGNSLKNNNIETLYFDTKGLLWIGLKTGGVDIYNPYTDQFIHLNEIVKENIPNRVIAIFEDSDSNIWLGSWEEGIYKLIPQNQTQTQFEIQKFYNQEVVSCFLEKPKGYIWAGTYNGLRLFDMNLNKWIHIIDNQSINAIHSPKGRNVLYCSSWNENLFKVKWDKIATKAKYKLLKVYNPPIHSIESDASDNLLFGTWGEGIRILSSEDKPITKIPATLKSINATFINALYKDRWGNIWIGSYGKGLYKYTPDNKGTSLLSSSNMHEPFTSILTYKNQVLLGTLGGGLFQYNLQTGEEKSIYHAKDKFKDHILSLSLINDITFIGHDGLGFLYQFAGQPLKEFKVKDEQLSKVTTFCSQGNKLWIGTKQNGLMSVVIDKDGKQLIDYIHYTDVNHDRINAITPYKNNLLLIASHNGLSTFNISTQKYEKQIINNDIVYSIIVDNKNNCWWVGTSNGLLKVEETNGVFNTININQQYCFLPQGAVKSLLQDSYHNLWFFIGDRIFYYNYDSKKLCEPNINYINSSILSAKEIIFQDKEYILLGDAKHLIQLDVEKIIHMADSANLIWTDLEINHEHIGVGEKINQQTILKKSTEYTSSLQVSHNSKWLSFSFTETGESNYINQYLYKLEGFSDQWQLLDLSRPLTFSQLNPGNYTLQIVKYNGEQKKLAKSIKIEILPPWWKSTTFYILSASCILSILVLILFFIINKYREKSRKEIQRMENQKKEELLKEKESFLEGFSHDLITPLSLIVTPAKDLLKESPQNSVQRERLSVIVKNATFLSELFSEILDIKQTELFSDMTINNKEVEIISFCHIIINAFNYLALSKKISLSYECPAQTEFILLDTVKFERILYNLLSNAIKYTPENGKITVCLEFTEQQFILKVKNTSPAIAMEHHEAIFNKFYRLPQYDKYDKKDFPQGLGIGLYVIKKLVHAMQGNIKVDSSSSFGVIFTVQLPAKRINSQEKVEKKSIMPNKNNSKASNILLVEDNEKILEYLSNALSNYFSIRTATNGEEALNEINKSLPEIVISDIMMPIMDGLTLCKKIKENPSYADIFVIILTAKISSEDELNGYKQGVDIYIKKPFDTEALIKQIMNILNTRQKRKNLLYQNFIVKDSEKQNHPQNINPQDAFLTQAMKVIEENLDKADFSTDDFASHMNISKTLLFKKFKKLVNQTPNHFIKEIRLKKAATLLAENNLSITEIAYLTGFNQVHYFIKCFKEKYGITPKGYRDNLLSEQHNSSLT